MVPPPTFLGSTWGCLASNAAEKRPGGSPPRISKSPSGGILDVHRCETVQRGARHLFSASCTPQDWKLNIQTSGVWLVVRAV